MFIGTRYLPPFALFMSSFCPHIVGDQPAPLSAHSVGRVPALCVASEQPVHVVLVCAHHTPPISKACGRCGLFDFPPAVEGSAR